MAPEDPPDEDEYGGRYGPDPDAPDGIMADPELDDESTDIDFTE